MKHKSLLGLFIFLMGLSVTTTSCEDMLTPDMNRYSEGFSGKDTVYFYLGILRNVQDMVEQNQLLGDLRSDLVNTTLYSSDSVANIINFKGDEDGTSALLNRAAYYKVINQCNFYLAKVDTTAAKNQVKYMLPEYAQVLNIRAWTYLQLVQTYGQVPFITEPVDNADTGWETNPPGGWANADNLLDLLKGDLEKSMSIEKSSKGYPEYGTFQSGNSKFTPSYKKFCFYSPIILGDLYLLKGQSQSDYVNAAKSYYDFLNAFGNTGGTLNFKSKSMLSSGKYASYSADVRGENDTIYSLNGVSWLEDVAPANTLSDEILTMIPSAANSTFGRVLTRVPQIYGFDPHSTQTTESDANGNIEDGESGKSGEVSLSAKYESRQVQPSNSFVKLCESQPYSYLENSSTMKHYSCGDGRLNLTVPYLQLQGKKYRFIVKEAPIQNVNREGVGSSIQYKHYRTIYRLKQIYLRYAEALNRAGYPRMAYAVLRNGLSNATFQNTYFTRNLVDSIVKKNEIPVYNEDGTPTLDENGLQVYRDSVHRDTVRNGMLTKAVATLSATDDGDPLHYISLYEMQDYMENASALLGDWTNSNWTANTGIYQFGTGTNCDIDPQTSYNTVVAQRIADEDARRGGSDLTGNLTIDYVKRIMNLESSTDTIRILDHEDEEFNAAYPNQLTAWKSSLTDGSLRSQMRQLEINAVETLIADEMAIETAYEGTRMFDLIRMMRHKNAAGQDGDDWISWKIGRRNFEYAPYEKPLEKGSFSISNLYIANPQ